MIRLIVMSDYKKSKVGAMYSLLRSSGASDYALQRFLDKAREVGDLPPKRRIRNITRTFISR